MLTKTVTYSMLRSQRANFQEMFWANKFARDRNDVHLLDLGSIREDVCEMEVKFDYKCIEVNLNPDFDW